MNIPSLLSSIDIQETVDCSKYNYIHKSSVLINKIFQVTDELIANKKFNGYLHIITNIGIAELFKNSLFFESIKLNHIPVGKFDQLVKYGILDKRWKIWIHSEMPSDLLVIGTVKTPDPYLEFDETTVSIKLLK